MRLIAVLPSFFRVVATVALLSVASPSLAQEEACIGDCDGDGEVSFAELITLVEAGVGAGQAAACGVDGEVVIDHVVQATGFASNGCPVAGTPTPTPTATPTRDPSAPLGTRRFVVNPNNGGFYLALTGFTPRLGGFMGQTNGVAEPAFLEFEAGVPDPETGIATIDVVGASEYLTASANLAGFAVNLCLKLEVPITTAGVIDCDGGSDYSIGLDADHNLGELGIDGFTADDCTEAGGTIEGGTRLCKTGRELDSCRGDRDCDTSAEAGDGICGLGGASPNFCVLPVSTRGETCTNDAQCDSSPGAENGQCGQQQPHVGVCNGQFTPAQGTGDTGPGSVTFAPFAGLNGLPARLNLESSLPCGDEGSGQELGFALTSTSARATIADANNIAGQNLTFALNPASGATPRQFELQNFSCDSWNNGSGPGCLGLVAPILHQVMGSDAITAFKLCGY